MIRPSALILAAVVLLVGVFIGVRLATKNLPAKNLDRAARASASTADGPADLILTNAHIETMDDADHAAASAVAIRGEKIVAVSYETSPDGAASPEIQKWKGPNTRILDLHGQFVMPGFNDAHLHLASAAYIQLHVNAEGSKSLAEFQQRIRDRLQDYQPGEWIVVDGWDHTLWTVKKFPTRQDLDAVSTKNPIIASRIDGHVAVVNSLALRMSDLTAKTPDPPGGRIERDPKTSEPTGMLDEDAAMDLV